MALHPSQHRPDVRRIAFIRGLCRAGAAFCRFILVLRGVLGELETAR